MVRFHEIVSPLPPIEAQNALLAALDADGFRISPDIVDADGWSLRYAVIGDDSRSNWSYFLLEVVPILALAGVRRHVARCAVPVAVMPDPHGSRLMTTTVWGFRGDGGSAGLVAKRVARLVEETTGRVGGSLRSSLTPLDPDAPIDGRSFERATGWKRKHHTGGS
jgi:hypothetical protein